jgi:molybdopterin converting factor small subunit
MPSIMIPTPLRPYVNGLPEVTVKGDTVSEAMDDLVLQYPAFKPHLFKQDGSLRAFVNLFLAGTNVKDLDGLQTRLDSGDTLRLVPSIAGG